jgi:hypothetical protein
MTVEEPIVEAHAAEIVPLLPAAVISEIRSTISIGGTGSRARKPSGGSAIRRP